VILTNVSRNSSQYIEKFNFTKNVNIPIFWTKRVCVLKCQAGLLSTMQRRQVSRFTRSHCSGFGWVSYGGIGIKVPNIRLGNGACIFF
jgi:hypothetical protein